MEMQEPVVFGSQFTADDILRDACLAAKWMEEPKDAIDTLILKHCKDNLKNLDDTYDQIDYTPFDPSIKRTEALLSARDGGGQFKCTKGAPHIILDMAENKDEIHEEVTNAINDLAAQGTRALGVGRTDVDGKWYLTGMLTFLDPPRHDTKETIARARALGIEVKMITGDQIAIAKETCFKLGMGTNIQGTDMLPGTSSDLSIAVGSKFGELCETADGFAEVFPEHKYMIVDVLQQRKWTTGMTGDGVNDAPALKKADIGIAVQGATDAARAAADIVLTEPGLSVIIDAIKYSRKIFHRMKNYVTYRIACTLQLLVFFFIAILAMKISMFHEYRTPCIVNNLTDIANDTTCHAFCNQEFFTDFDKYGVKYGVPGTTKENWGCNTNNIPNLTSWWPSNYRKADGYFPIIELNKTFIPDPLSDWCAQSPKDKCDESTNLGIPDEMIKKWKDTDSDTRSGAFESEAVFALPVLAIVVLTILNDGTIITIARDKVVPGDSAEKWHLWHVFVISTVLGMFACLSSLILLWQAMCGAPTNILGPMGERECGESIFQSWFGVENLTGISVEQARTVIYLKICLSDFMTVFSARTRGFFFERRPGYALLTAFLVATAISTLFALTIPWGLGETDAMLPLGFGEAGVVWLYCIIMFLVGDLLKVGCNVIIFKFFIVPDSVGPAEQRNALANNRFLLAQEHKGNHNGFSNESSMGTGSGVAPRNAAECASRIHTLTNQMTQMADELKLLQQFSQGGGRSLSNDSVDAKSGQ